MSALSSELLPDPVLPATSACWRVPSPSSRCCRRLAPLRPSGTRKADALDMLHRSSARGATDANGTSTRFPSRAARPTSRVMRCRSASPGGGSGTNARSATRPSSRRHPGASPSRHVTESVPRRRSDASIPGGRGVRRSIIASTCTPQRAPLWRMLANRRAACSLTLTGKSAITRNRYGSAISPACALYASIDGYSFRRYFWITVSMWSVRSASRCSMCRTSVHTRSVTRISSSSARCMKPAKPCPSPTGSTKVKRAFPAGTVVSTRATAFCRIASASSRRSGGASITIDMRSGAKRNAGMRQVVEASAPGQARAGSAGTACGTSRSGSSTDPTRMTGMVPEVAARRSHASGVHGNQPPASTARTRSSPSSTARCSARQAPVAASEAASNMAAASASTASCRARSSSSARSQWVASSESRASRSVALRVEASACDRSTLAR